MLYKQFLYQKHVFVPAFFGKPGVCFTKKYVRTVLMYCYSATVRGYELYIQTNAHQTWDSQIL